MLRACVRRSRPYSGTAWLQKEARSSGLSYHPSATCSPTQGPEAKGLVLIFYSTSPSLRIYCLPHVSILPRVRLHEDNTLLCSNALLSLSFFRHPFACTGKTNATPLLF